MTKGRKITISVLSIIGGWLLNALAWTTKIAHPFNTAFLILGIGLMIFGLIFLIIALTK